MVKVSLGMGEVFSSWSLFFAFMFFVWKEVRIKLMPYTCIQMSTAGFMSIFRLTLEKIPIGTDVSDWFSCSFYIFLNTNGLLLQLMHKIYISYDFDDLSCEQFLLFFSFFCITCLWLKNFSIIYL